MKIYAVLAAATLLTGCFSTSITTERLTRASNMSEQEAMAIVTQLYGREWAERPTLNAGVGDPTCNGGKGKVIQVAFTEMTVMWSSNPIATYGDAPDGFPHGLVLQGPATAGFWCGTVFKDYRYFRTLEKRDSFVDAMIRLGAKVETK
jgi:hypothetical protein